jgi:hypothetical protein
MPGATIIQVAPVTLPSSPLLKEVISLEESWRAELVKRSLTLICKTITVPFYPGLYAKEYGSMRKTIYL